MEISWEVIRTYKTLLLFITNIFTYLRTIKPSNCIKTCFQPLTYREWNGPHLKYLVWWRRRDSREEWKNATTKWLKYYIYDADTFTPYEIKVQAVNDFGLGPESPVVIGYSGEGRKYLHFFYHNIVRSRNFGRKSIHVGDLHCTSVQILCFTTLEITNSSIGRISLIWYRAPSKARLFP